MKSEVDKLDIDRLESAPFDLSKLGDAVKYDVVKNTEYDELVKKAVIKTSDTSDLLKKLAMTQKFVKLKRKYLIMIMMKVDNSFLVVAQYNYARTIVMLPLSMG